MDTIEPYEIHKLLHDQAAWILKNLKQLDTRRAENEKKERQYRPDTTFPYFGEQVPLVFRWQKGISRPKAIRVILEQSPMQFVVYLSLNDTITNDDIRQAFRAWFLQTAKVFLPDRVAILAAQHHFEYNKVGVRQQKTVWGTCSGKGNLSLNARLLLLPPDAIDHIIRHELCHLEHMNHSPAFWNLLETIDPDTGYWRRWFRENEALYSF